jgi:hypothetical protein
VVLLKAVKGLFSNTFLIGDFKKLRKPGRELLPNDKSGRYIQNKNSNQMLIKTVGAKEDGPSSAGYRATFSGA